MKCPTLVQNPYVDRTSKSPVAEKSVDATHSTLRERRNGSASGCSEIGSQPAV